VNADTLARFAASHQELGVWGLSGLPEIMPG
jgi:hypothetical protein